MTREEAMEIIDKMPLCNECDNSIFPYTCVECGNAFLKAMDALRQPEIVRCKDCKHYEPDKFAPGKGDCNGSCDNLVKVYDEWFCAGGAKRDNE